MNSDLMRATLLARLRNAALIFGTVVLLGASGYAVIGAGHWPWYDCFYFTIATLARADLTGVIRQTAGFPFAKTWTTILVVLGSGTVIYFVSALTAGIVEGDIRGLLRRTRMQKKTNTLSNHVIVCGLGATGLQVVRELMATQTPFLVIDKDESRLERVSQELNAKLIFLVGDASEDHVLQAAAIERARGIVAALPEDKDNLFVTVSARALNSKLRIVAKAVDPSASAKLQRAGANAVVSPGAIGGMRLASEMIRPSVVQFLDLMLRDKDQNLRIEEVALSARSPLVGKPLADADLRKHADVLVVAVKTREGHYQHNPRPELVLTPDMVLIVLAQVAELSRLRVYVDPPLISAAPA